MVPLAHLHICVNEPNAHHNMKAINTAMQRLNLLRYRDSFSTTKSKERFQIKLISKKMNIEGYLNYHHFTTALNPSSETSSNYGRMKNQRNIHHMYQQTSSFRGSQNGQMQMSQNCHNMFSTRSKIHVKNESDNSNKLSKLETSTQNLLDIETYPIGSFTLGTLREIIVLLEGWSSVNMSSQRDVSIESRDKTQKIKNKLNLNEDGNWDPAQNAHRLINRLLLEESESWKKIYPASEIWRVTPAMFELAIKSMSKFGNESFILESIPLLDKMEFSHNSLPFNTESYRNIFFAICTYCMR